MKQKKLIISAWILGIFMICMLPSMPSSIKDTWQGNGVRGSDYSTGFEWGLVGKVNTAVRTWEPIFMENSSITGWECAQMKATGTLDLATNFVNTTQVAGQTYLHMENRDDSNSGFRSGQARTTIDATGITDNLLLNFSVQTKRYDGAYDNSFVEVAIMEDTDGDAVFTDAVDYALNYIINNDDSLDTFSPINNTVGGNATNVLLLLPSNFDGVTWTDFSRNITADWLAYKGWALNKTSLQIRLVNYQRIDYTPLTYYIWSNWDNVTLYGKPAQPDTTSPVVTITSPGNGATLHASSVCVNFTAIDLHKDKTWYIVDGGSPIIVSGSSISLALSNGAHSISVFANDTSGNIGSDMVGVNVHISSVPYTEGFEWGAIGHVNTVMNTWDPIYTEGGSFTDWNCTEVTTESLSMSLNFVNTTSNAGQTYLHMENWDEAADGWRHGYAQTFVDITGAQENLFLNFSVQGERYDGIWDTSFLNIQIFEDTNGDGQFSPTDHSLNYIINNDDSVYLIDPIDHSVSGREARVLAQIPDWTGATWTHFSRNLTYDWLHYKGFKLNTTCVKILLTNYQRCDNLPSNYYIRSNWDNISLYVPIDTSGPAITVNSPANGAIFGSSSVGLNVYVADPDLSTIWYVLDGGVATLFSNTSIIIADGTHSITFYANNTLGYVSSVTRTFTVDTVVPSVAITSPSDDATLSSGTVNVAFTATDLNKDDTWYTVDSGTPTIVTGNSFSISLADGTHSIAVYCNDTFGWITSDSVTFTIDATYPVIIVNGPANGAIFGSSSVGLNVYVADPNLSTIWYVLDGGVATLFSNTSIMIADGTHSIAYYANDTFGNTNSATRTFTVDTTAPVVAITSPSNNANISSGTVDVAFTAIDLTKDATWYTVDGGASTIVAGSSFSISLADGAHSIVVYCNDSLGQVDSDSVAFTIDATDPTIDIDGFAGLSLQQGDVQYLNWTLSDAHPATYALRLNGQVVRSGTYVTGTEVSVLIDSSTVGQLNYTMIAQDTFGNVNNSQRLISVVERTDGGIFLHVNINTINRNATNGIVLTLTMSHWAVLYLDVSVTVVPTSMVLPGALPSGMVIALPVAFNLNITNSSALASGSIRIYYSQSSIANQVNENTMVPMRWDECTSSWVTTTSGLSRTDNYVDISLSENGLYVIAAKPKENYIPIIIIVLIGVTGGIVAVAGYSYSRKKSLKMKGVGASSKGKTMNSYVHPIAPTATTASPASEADGKRARLMQFSASQEISTRNEITRQTAIPAMDPAKKVKTTMEQDVDLATRKQNANEMASEVQVEQVVPKCIVHKGPISGFSYSCKACGVIYCVKCVRHLAETNQACWNCGASLDIDEERARPEALIRDDAVVSVISEEVWNKIEQLGLQEDILDEVLGKLKTIPPQDRVAYLERTFPDDEEYDGKI